MIKQITYLGLLGVSFYLGSCQKEVPSVDASSENSSYAVIQRNDVLYLRTPTALHRINELDQVGSVHHRLSGLLHENPGEVRRSLDILKSLHEPR